MEDQTGKQEHLWQGRLEDWLDGSVAVNVQEEEAEVE